MDDITKQLFLEKIEASIDDYKPHADELFKLINTCFDNENDRLKNIAKLYLQRYYVGLISVSTLIREFKFYKPIEFSYAVILRTLLLDFITIEYLRYHKNLGNEVFSKCLEEINYLSADDSNRYCDSLNEHKEGFRGYISKTVFPENFEIDKNTGNYKLKKAKPLQPWRMAIFFKDKPEPYAFDAYRLYNHFSLIEHYNNLTFYAMKGDNYMNLKNLIWTMFYIFQGHHTCLDILDFFPNHSVDILSKRDYFLKLIHEIK
jgi:hypothetical protein